MGAVGGDMSELSSCYFCGTALDAPVKRYPLTPSSVDADTGRTVALCPTCRRKLGKVIEIVTEEIDGSVGDADPNADGEPAGTAATDTDPAADADLEPTVDDATDESTTPDAADGSTGDESADDVIVAGPSDDGATDESGTTGDGATGDGATDEPETTGDGATDAPDEDGRSDGAGDASAVLSTPAAQKIIKLLQNREFPVDREEFEIVASNAYDIPMDECTDVVDTLVAEGYVGERDGHLVAA